MSALTLAWIVSITGALAFFLAGFFFGHRRVPATLETVSTERLAVEPPAPPTSAVPPLATQVVPPAPAALTPVTPPLPRTHRSKTVDGRYLEGRLSRSLRDLDPERALSQLVLCDETGLPIAAADTPSTEGGHEDPETLSALGAEALTLMGRVGVVLAESRTVTVGLESQRHLQIRPIAGDGVPLFLVTIGHQTVSDTRFATFAGDVRTLINTRPTDA